ncbi:methionyl-tRNA formyltransferase [Candidatus Uhrbacteria bacterium CG10_big_fil_rev_8_21_14_0_10_50_16]|uniref:Methionyl-tRNA formyltransferase n=1 Tax=Candidatus Uhrbacteria bacterium CG10_big_fil_rev_8_21_14_0_10_50_16 TaxID=1975039 RepID=A0A2H0RN17_9BACT|nr:MAG: methionyl-tRNA formyltransferase [Candidatus Uhrbacteria bacterium CG10_big_fil_rev_8_21_14_0_10_50_16]
MVKIVYFGTPEVSTYGLQALVDDARFEVVAVVTQPPKPVGRSATIQTSPIHALAGTLGIRVLTPTKAKEIEPELTEIAADLHVVVAFGQILPQSIVDLPPYGTLNIHPSLLPRWRGAAPVPATILAGDTLTGVCIMVMDAKMDHGPILDVSELPVDSKTTQELLPELMNQGAQRLPDVANDWIQGILTPQDQDHEAATFCKMLSRDDARIDWQRGFAYTERQVRAYTPWPGTWTEVETPKGWQRIKILKAHVDATRDEAIVLTTTNGLTSIGQLVLDELQFESKTPALGTDVAKTQKGLTLQVR